MIALTAMKRTVIERDAGAVAVHRAGVAGTYSRDAAAVAAAGVTGRTTMSVVFIIVTASQTAAGMRPARAHAIAS